LETIKIIFTKSEEALKLSLLAQEQQKIRRKLRERVRRKVVLKARKKAAKEAQIAEESKKNKLDDGNLDQSITNIDSHSVFSITIILFIYNHFRSLDDLQDSNSSGPEIIEESEQDHSFGDYISK